MKVFCHMQEIINTEKGPHMLINVINDVGSAEPVTVPFNINHTPLQRQTAIGDAVKAMLAARGTPFQPATDSYQLFS